MYCPTGSGSGSRSLFIPRARCARCGVVIGQWISGFMLKIATLKGLLKPGRHHFDFTRVIAISSPPAQSPRPMRTAIEIAPPMP
jgi:hypothetical protein